MKFSDFNFQPALLQALVEMGYEAPTPIQAQTIPLLIQSKDVIGCARTGSGKTAAFALPVLDAIKGGQQNPQALIIAPTRELAEQIRIAVDDYAKHLPVTCLAIYGGASSRLQETQLSKGVDVVIATPGRLLDLLQRSAIRLYDVKYLILDEADRMLDMGFVPDIEEIMTFLPRKRQTLLFSATMPDAIKSLAFSLTKDAEMIRIGIENAASDSVDQSVMLLSSQEKPDALMQIIKTHNVDSMIVFARTKTGADQVAKTLIQNHVAATCIHSNRTQSQRQSALEAFRNGEYKVLVATDVAARGIDVSHISHVINYDTPTHAEDYVHRVGRTGRAGAKGVAFTFTSSNERKYLKDIEKLIGNPINVVALNDSGPSSTAEEAPAVVQKAEVKKTTAKAKKPAPKKAKAVKTKAASEVDAQVDGVEKSSKPEKSEKTTQAKTTKKAKAPKSTKALKTVSPEKLAATETAQPPVQTPVKPTEQQTSKASTSEGAGKGKRKTQKAAAVARTAPLEKVEKSVKVEKAVRTEKAVDTEKPEKKTVKKGRRNANEKTASRRRDAAPVASSHPESEERDRKTSRRRNDVLIAELPTPRFKPEQSDVTTFRKRHVYSVIQAEPRMSESHAFYRNPEDELDYLEFQPEERSQGEDPMKAFPTTPQRSSRSPRRNTSSRGGGRSRQQSRQRTR
jgi:ATP-dependent RNA helicase RhlE